jgi:GAF domain-containing protein
VQPLPEVTAAVDRLSALTGDLDLAQGLAVVSDVARTLVPSCVGVSITVVVDGESFTVTSTSEEMAVLDASQYLASGPCTDAATSEVPIAVRDVLDERRWQFYDRAAAARGVASSLSLPLGASGRLPGAMNFYAGEPGAFAGKEQMLAEVFGVPADAFVTNADLSFMTRDFARQLPQQLEEKARLDRAVGLLSSMRGEERQQARTRLLEAAGRARVPVSKVADLVLELSAP